MAEADWVDPICQKFAPEAWQDLRQELFIYCAIEHRERAEVALQNDCLQYFYIRCAANYTREKGRISQLWQRGGQEIGEEQEGIEDEPPQWPEGEERELEAVAKVYAGLDWYERKLIDLYLGGWSERRIYRETGITDKEVRRVRRMFRERVMREL